MPDDTDRGDEKPWQGRRPGWDFDGWGVARGGRKRGSGIVMRAHGADRMIGIVGWSTFGVLLAASAFTNNMRFGAAAIIVAVSTAASRKAIRYLRRRHPDEG